MRKTPSGCSMRQTPCIFSIMVSMLGRPTLVLSEEAGTGSTQFSKQSPALLPSCTKRTTTSLSGSAYLSRLETNY